MRFLVRVLPLLFAAAASAQQGTKATPGQIPVRIETTVGNIDATLDSSHAPISVANFLKYVDAKAYDSATFYRVVRMDNQPTDSIKIEVIQAAKGRGKASFPPIPIEHTNVTGLKHLNGTLSMARSSDPISATNSFSIVIGDQPSMDFGGKRNPDGLGFTAFGRVTSGMDVVKKIQAGKVGDTFNNRQTLVEPVVILRIVRR